MAIPGGRDGLTATPVLDGICPGAHVDTPVGEVPAERLREGDIVLLAGGGIGVIKWIGRIDTPSRPPVLIAAAALNPRTPRRPLLVAPDQAILVAPATAIPARLLLNRSTLQMAGQTAPYLQIALRDGACFLVEGLAVRSADAPADVVAEPGDRRPPITTAGPALAAAIARLAGPETDFDADRAARLAATLAAIEQIHRAQIPPPCAA